MLLLIKILSDYLTILDGDASVINDLVMSIQELMRVFNSRSCQLVLGAGATRSAGLKSITAKHISLLIRNLDLIIYICASVTSKLTIIVTNKAVLADFSRIEKQIVDHRGELVNKLVTIMLDRLTSHCRNPWPDVTGAAPKAVDDYSPYVRSITNETNLLHGIISKILEQSDVFSIFQRVFTGYARILNDMYSRVDIMTTVLRVRYDTYITMTK